MILVEWHCWTQARSRRARTPGVEEVNQRERLPRASWHCPYALGHSRSGQSGECPHLSANEAFAVVHNGIFSNYQDLQEELEAEGVTFCSQTDTEVFVQLMARHYQRLQNTERAFVAALEQMEGSFAIVMISVHEPDRLFCAKRDSPLILGLVKTATTLARISMLFWSIHDGGDSR